MKKYTLEQLKSCIFGLAIGDALGVPVEFKPRTYLQANPVSDMLGYGTYHQPPGTWSDDSSLTFCLLESLSRSYNLQDLANRFVQWREQDYWTPHGEVFDIGITTNSAIQALLQGTSPTLAGEKSERSNGNGSLMRIAPLAFYLLDQPIVQRWQIVKDVSSITHRHIRASLGGFIYIELILNLLAGKDKLSAYQSMREGVNNFLNTQAVASESEVLRYHNLLTDSLLDMVENEISGAGYVVSTLEAAVWCFLHQDNYPDTVLKAVNLGEDTDTTATVAGALAGLYYGMEQIPAKWLNQLARQADIDDLINRFYDSNS
ncbi:MAG: ADP-ribosylglycohydrolase family protein [Microscillaceae bacterium]|jgi:ADP-ribosylglycohydrolase|nr:ADP-ribosylglycohydrolase family protein [Microscillaceae bacterium]